MIVLDTHALIWWASGQKEQISEAATQAIEAELKGGDILVSSISAWELAMLVAKGRLALSLDVSDWLTLVGQIESVRFVPMDNEIAIKSAGLPGAFHKDPADRIIVATARKFGAALVTADERIRGFPNVHTIW